MDLDSSRSHSSEDDDDPNDTLHYSPKGVR